MVSQSTVAEAAPSSLSIVTAVFGGDIDRAADITFGEIELVGLVLLEVPACLGGTTEMSDLATATRSVV